jgi:hypothetical protein
MALALASCLAACEGVGLGKLSIVDNAASPIIERQGKAAKVDLVAMLDPEQYGRERAYLGLRRVHASVSANPATVKFFEILREQVEKDAGADSGIDMLENAIAGFYDSRYDTNTQARRRNGVVGRLVGASDQECSYFLDQIRQEQAGFNFAFGALTTILGGAGAITTATNLARALAGSAAIASGVRAEGNDTNFRQLTAEVIVRGIKARRAEYLKTITTHRAQAITEYTVEDAIADGMIYHAHCNLIHGLEHASTQVLLSQDIGLRRTMTLLAEAGIKGPVSFNPQEAKEAATLPKPEGDVSEPAFNRDQASKAAQAAATTAVDFEAEISRLKKQRSTIKADSLDAAGTKQLADIDDRIMKLDDYSTKLIGFADSASQARREAAKAEFDEAARQAAIAVKARKDSDALATQGRLEASIVETAVKKLLEPKA